MVIFDGVLGCASPVPVLAESERAEIRRRQSPGAAAEATLSRLGRLAQLGERLPYKQEVGGSSPSPPIEEALETGPFLVLGPGRSGVATPDVVSCGESNHDSDEDDRGCDLPLP